MKKPGIESSKLEVRIFELEYLMSRILEIKKSNSTFLLPTSKLSTQGFTLIELMVAITIVISVGYILSAVLIQSNNTFLSQNSKVSQGLDLNQSSLVINEAIKSASAIVTSSVSIPVYTTSANTLVLTVPAIDSTGNAIDGVSDYIIFTPDSVNSQILRQVVIPTLPQSSRIAENRVLLNQLSSINFIYLDQANNPVAATSASRISYTINVSQKAGLGIEQSLSSSVINLRND